MPGRLRRRPRDRALLEGFRHAFRLNGELLDVSEARAARGLWRGFAASLTRNPEAFYVRLPVDTVEELDAWVEELRASVPGGTGITRSDVIRDLVVEAMAERREGRRGKGKR